MNFIEKNKQNLLYAILILSILTIFLPYYSLTVVKTMYHKGMDLDSIIIVPIVSLLTMFFVYKDSKFAIWGFTILSLISITYMIIGIPEIGHVKEVKTSSSYGLYLLLLLSMIGLYIKYTTKSIGNANIKVIKMFYVLSIIISSFMIIVFGLSLFDGENGFFSNGFNWDMKFLGSVLSMIMILDFILLWPIMRLVLQKNRLQLIDDKNESIVDQIDEKNKKIKKLLIFVILSMVIIVTWGMIDESLKIF